MSSHPDQSLGVIIKSDRVGRTRYTREYKQEVLAAFESSALSAPDFAQQCGIKYPTFAAWVAGRNGSPRESSSAIAPTFLVAEVGDAMDASVLEVRLPGGAIARVAGTAQIRQLAELLRQLA
jgi:hypothetical protein